MFVSLLIVLICGNTVSAVGFVMSARIGHSVVLQCEGDVTLTMSVIWKIHLLNNNNCLLSRYISNELKLHNNCSERIKYDNLSLTIHSVQISDEGNYRCETVTGYNGTFINVTTLQVLAEPSVTLVLNSEGSPECRAIGGYPAAEISWIPHSHDINTTSAENPDQTWTGISTYSEKRDNVTSVTCVVSHPTFMYPQEKSISVPAWENYSTWVLVIIPALFLIAACIVCWKRSQLRKCFKKSFNTNPPQQQDVIEQGNQEFEPYDTYTQKENIIYCEARGLYSLQQSI
ncbi:cell surface glycoprotein CD200 receptor 1-B-like [Mixophyes fleayi]|uniref:cell surface glycoprotein CD200 receptor 1-B-like n=1 Tax=Mixophyes fleayi TaxID=3061075 RepID=UPI003F4E3D7A